MTIGTRIKTRREELGMSQEELAKKIGYKSRSSINKIELNSCNLRQSKIKSIADALLTTPSYIMGWEESANIGGIEEAIPINKVKVPLLGAIACGEPIFADEDFECYIDVACDLDIDYALRCEGDSMINARINDGDVVFVKKQDIVENGEIAVVIIDDKATLKRVFYYPEQNKLILQAENPAYPPFVYVNEELDDIRIIGKAIAFQSLMK